MTQRDITMLDELWEATTALDPEYSPEERRAGLALLRELAKGEPVSSEQLAQALGTSTSEAEELLKGSALTPFTHLGEDGRVAGFWGLSTVRTHHRFTIGERTLWTWCAEDSLFLPGLIGETAQIESQDPEGGELVRLTISPDAVEAVEPNGVVVSVIRPDTWDLTSAARIRKTACNYIFFFASRALAERWVSKHPNTLLLSLEEAFEFGKRQNARVFGVG